MTDIQIKAIWVGLNVIDFDEDEYMEQLLREDYFIWKKGETRSNIWKWFDDAYSSGLYYLLHDIGSEVAAC